MTAPERSLAQRMEALERANEIRCARARLKRDVKAQRADVIEALRRPPWWIESMKVVDLLLAMPKIGRVKAHRIVQSHRISPTKTVGGLSERQRAELVRVLSSRRGTLASCG